MGRPMIVAMILAAGAAGLMPDAASARETGPFGDWRASCRMFQMAVPLNMGARPLRPAMESGVAYRNKREGTVEFYHFYWPVRHSAQSRCLAGF
jgi:hypothetical protein